MPDAPSSPESPHGNFTGLGAYRATRSPALVTAPTPWLEADRYLTTARLVQDTLLLAARLPDVSAVVGVSRSGMLPATVLACHLHRPLWAVSPWGVVDCGHGVRLEGAGNLEQAAGKPVLIVDDTVFAGRTLSRVLPRIADHFGGPGTGKMEKTHVVLDLFLPADQ